MANRPTQPFIRPNLPIIDIYRNVFESFINERGVNIAWEKAVLCPCGRVDENTGTPSFNCGLCYQGNRYIDRKEILGTVTNITGQRNVQVFGDVGMGGIFLTVAGEHRLAVQDRIYLVEQTARYNESCSLATTTARATAAVGATSITVDSTRKFPLPKDPSGFVTIQIGSNIIRYSGKTATALTGIPVSGPGSIVQPIALNATVNLMEYSLRYDPQQVISALTQTATLVEGVDYEIIEKRRLRFLVNRWVPKFTVAYESYPVYLVDSLPHEFRDQITKVGVERPYLERLPVAAVCRRDVFGDPLTK